MWCTIFVVIATSEVDHDDARDNNCDGARDNNCDDDRDDNYCRRCWVGMRPELRGVSYSSAGSLPNLNIVFMIYIKLMVDL